MSLSEYQTKVNKVQAIVWDGLDATYDVLTPIIGRSIKSYTKLNGADTGALVIRVNSVDVVTVAIGDYIVITDSVAGTFKIMTPADFNTKYEPVSGDSGLIEDEEDEVIQPPSTASQTFKGV